MNYTDHKSTQEACRASFPQRYKPGHLSEKNILVKKVLDDHVPLLWVELLPPAPQLCAEILTVTLGIRALAYEFGKEMVQPEQHPAVILFPFFRLKFRLLI